MPSLKSMHPLWLWSALLLVLAAHMQPWLEWRCAALSSHLPALLLPAAAILLLLNARAWPLALLRVGQILVGGLIVLIALPGLLWATLAMADNLSCTRYEGFLHGVQWQLQEDRGHVLRERRYSSRCGTFMDDYLYEGSMRSLEIPALPWRLILEDRRCDWNHPA